LYEVPWKGLIFDSYNEAMKRFLIFLLFIISSWCKAQSLTNAQVYNFDVGDVFQTFNTWAASYSNTYETITVLNKTISIGNDTIVYTLQVDKYTPPPPPCSTCTPTYNSAVVTQTITNLTGFPQHNQQSSGCVGPCYDSLFTDSCGRSIWEKGPIPSVSCTSTPVSEITSVVDGAGGPYFEYLSHPMPTPGQPWSKRLIYYQKMSGSCGNYVTSMEELRNESVSIAVFPNPSSEEIKISSPVVIYYYDIMDANGKVIQAGSLKDDKIDITNLGKGMYYVNFYSLKGKTFRKKVVKS
jgi:hypothetical protein